MADELSLMDRFPALRRIGEWGQRRGKIPLIPQLAPTELHQSFSLEAAAKQENPRCVLPFKQHYRVTEFSSRGIKVTQAFRK